MKITILTAFPELIRRYLETSILGRGIKSGKLEVEAVDLRDYAGGRYRQIDDYSFGSGGMVLMADPLLKALSDLTRKTGVKPWVVCPSPQGVVLHQELIESLREKEHLLIICGHYEGVDERFVERFVDLEFSLGDFVLTGGELPALALVDALARLIPGVVGQSEAVVEDSFYRGMLDHPHYTRPALWEGQAVPEVLISGDHNKILRWRRRQAALRTLRRRPDVLSRANIQPYLSHGVYVSLIHHPVLDRHGAVSTTAVTGLDIHDIARACRTYGVRRCFIITPLKSQREMIEKITEHWIKGYGATFNPDRGEALKLIKSFSSIHQAVEWVEHKEKAEPLTVATTAKKRSGSIHWLELKRLSLEKDLPLFFMFGTGWGLSSEVFENCDVILNPIRGGTGDYNHLSVRNAVGIVLDRFFGWR